MKKYKNLVPATEMLKKAFIEKYAIGAFNINNLEWTKIILETAQEKKSPIILGVSEGAAKYMGGYKVVSNMVEALIEELKITIPVALHLDHGSSFEECKAAIESGFSSVMLDCSEHSINENIALTKKVVDYAHSKLVSVEAEVGTVGGEEDGVIGGISYAKLEDCKRLVEETKIDFLAASLGSVHGHYKGKPKLGFKEMKEISSNVNIPLVLHGGSGIPEDMLKKSISLGEAKINVNTELQESFTKGIREYIEKNLDKERKGFDPRKVLKLGVDEIRKKVIEKMTIFGSINKV